MKLKPSKPRNPVVVALLNSPKRGVGKHVLSRRKTKRDEELIKEANNVRGDGQPKTTVPRLLPTFVSLVPESD